MINLPDVTLIALSSIKIQETINAMQFSMRGIDFGDAVLVTDVKFSHPTIRRENGPRMSNIDDYNVYAFKYLGLHVQTKYALVIQYDSCVIFPELWSDEWLRFDYIGAPWGLPIDDFSYRANNGEVVRVGNGGFSLRSQRLMRIPHIYDWKIREDHGYFNEDGNIVCYFRQEMLDLGIKYAPVEVAAHFSYENEVPENQGIKSFGCHKHIRWEWKEELGL